MQFLTPGFFDALVVIAIVIALLAIGLRVYHDFRRGPRWPQASGSSHPQRTLSDQADQQENQTND